MELTLIILRNTIFIKKNLCYFFPQFALSIIRKMASDTDHLSRTAANTRQMNIATAEVTKIDNLSSTVKRLHLHISDQDFSFKAGQWVDMFIPGVETVGGFSMCSAPETLVETKTLHLAVKFSNHPPAFWVHTQCHVGDKVKLRFGGDFYYDPQPGTDHTDLLLVAGGVGINPLYSILQHFLFLHSKVAAAGDNSSVHGHRVSLLYSAKNTEELIFQKELVQIAEDFENFQLKMYSTQEPAADSKYITDGRLELKDFKQALANLDKKKTDIYICGPLPFIETVKLYCKESDIPENSVFFEKWW